jgi:hypothetical protein
MRLRAVLFVALMVCATRAWSAPIMFTDRAAFEAAAGGTTRVDFGDGNSSKCEQPFIGFADTSCVFSNVLLVTSTQPNLISGHDELWVGQLDDLDVTLINPITAIGFDIITNRALFLDHVSGVMSHDGRSAAATIFGTTYEVVAPDPFHTTFMGFIFNEPVMENNILTTPHVWKYVDGRPIGAQYSITNVVVHSTPEPSTLLMLGLGAFSLIGRRFYRHAESPLNHRATT